MNWHDYIHSDPSVMVGKPVIRGTRLSVEFLLGLLAEGWTERQILEVTRSCRGRRCERHSPLQSNVRATNGLRHFGEATD